MPSYPTIKNLLTRPVAFHRIFAELTGGATSGLFLSQLWYWHDKTKDPSGWLFKTYEEWHEETCLSRSEIDRARKSLKKLGILEEKKAGIPLRLFYQLKVDALISLIATLEKQPSTPIESSLQNPANKNAESSKQECKIQQTAVQNLANKNAESSKHIYKDTENTSENTSKEEPWEKTVNAIARPPIGGAEIIAYFGSLPSDRVGVEPAKPENQTAVTEKIVINQTDLIGATEKKELEFRRAESVTRTANPARTKQTINQQVKELINKICSWNEFYTKRKAYLESCDFYKKSGIQAVEGTILKPYRELIENGSKSWHSEEDRSMAIAEATELIKQHATELGIKANSNAQQAPQNALTKRLEELIELHKNNPQQAANLAKGNPMIWNKFVKHINKETTHV